MNQLLISPFILSEELWRSRGGIIHHGLTLLDLHNSSDDTQPHPTILLMTL